MSDERRDVIIIGAGVIGAAIALELSRLGLRTLTVDKLPAAGYGPTSNSCSIVRAHYSSAEGVAMAHIGFSYWERWHEYLDAPDERGYARYNQCGTVLLKSSDGHADRVLGHFRDLGVEYEEWSVDELRCRFPFVATGRFWPVRRPDDEEFWTAPSEDLDGAVFTPRSGYVNDPQLATHNLQCAAERLGAEFWFGADVVEVRRDHRVRGVTLADGRKVDAPIVVNVAGPFSFVVNQMAGVEEEMRIRTRALRHEVHHVPAPRGIDFALEGCHFSDGDAGIYFRPESGNNILVGSEDPACDTRIWVDDPDDYERHVTRTQWEAQVYRLCKRLPSLTVPNETRGIVDLYDVSDDWIPIYDRSSLPGFYMAVGTSGNQFKNAPVVGELMAGLIDRVEAGQDHDATPVLVQPSLGGPPLNAGFYSRLRSVNANSTFSVNG
jgi:sarcosine oxidase subunit beta